MLAWRGRGFCVRGLRSGIIEAVRDFRYLDEVEDWLAPMDYAGFWVAIAPLDLALTPKPHCDGQIGHGEIDEATVLYCLKAMARDALGERHGLGWKPATPWLKVVQ